MRREVKRSGKELRAKLGKEWKLESRVREGGEELKERKKEEK